MRRLRRYRFEPAVLVLVALAALPVVHVVGAQDVSRLGLTRAVALHGSLRLGPFAGSPGQIDRAVYNGRAYSDKPPGMSFLALPGFEAMRAGGADRPPSTWRNEGDLQLWGLRLLSGGLAFLAAVFLVGRAGEAVAAGAGALTAVGFGLGTLTGPLAATTFDHVAAGLVGFAAFVLAWEALERRSTRLAAAAGACAGAGVLFEYQMALVAVLVFLYVVRSGLRPAVAYVAGAAPGLALLGAYNTAAFGSPFHLSYRYVHNQFAADQRRGLFGIGLPRGHSIDLVLIGGRGLLVLSPVLIAATVGLFLLARRHRAEALLCGAVTALFLIATVGYFLPYGGKSPGPRFFAPALPFLALGLAASARRFPRTTIALTLVSVVLTTFDALTWALRPDPDEGYLDVGLAQLAKTAWVWIVPDRRVGAMLVLAAALAAVAVASAALVRPTQNVTPATRAERMRRKGFVSIATHVRVRR